MLASAAARRQYRWTSLALVGALAAFPVVGSLVSAEFNWDAADFALWAVMIAVLGGALLLIPRLLRSSAGLSLGLVAAVLAFLLVWAELAVGIFD